MLPSPTAISAPGKVLLAGGFIVLDRAYTGLVFGLDARIHVLVEAISTTDGVTLSEIIVKSPQFAEALWEYSYREAPDNGGTVVTQLRAAASQHIHRNPFVEAALGHALTYVAAVAPGSIHSATVTILADNDYYSAPVKRPRPSTTAAPPRFYNFGTPLSETNKTGLGSSAALVTAFTAALLSHYLPRSIFTIDDQKGRNHLHNLTQAAHCAAQGKVGSGFDVASAVYGSCVYRRFSPSLLQSQNELGTPGFATALTELVQATHYTWDTEVNKSAVTIPPGIRLVMCDVDCGSETPGMVKKVLAWRQEQGEFAESIWRALQQANEALVAELVRLGEDGGCDYEMLRECILNIRLLVQQMSAASGVPIEPPSQTMLLDDCSAIPGVIGGVVPGAGGFDAIALLVEDRHEVLAALADLFQRRPATLPGQETVKVAGRASLLGVREEMHGVKREDPVLYQAWA